MRYFYFLSMARIFVSLGLPTNDTHHVLGDKLKRETGEMFHMELE